MPEDKPFIVTTKGTSAFTIDDGLKIQSEHLADWETKLHPDCHKDLVAFATATNDQAKDGFAIRRGSSLSNFIANWKPKKHQHVMNCVEMELLDAKDGDEIRIVIQENKAEIWNGNIYTGRHLFK